MNDRLDRRTVLGAAVAASVIAVLEGCNGQSSAGGSTSTTTAAALAPVGGAVQSTAALPDTTTATTSTTSTVVAPTTAAPTTSAAPATGAPATYVNHGSSTSSAVALTFHLGGEPTLVTKLLDLMRDSQLHVTAFAIGSWITAHAELGRRVVADGHE
ncbi:MAG TPA: polysaccharide deacetylase family protein, partial [Ilumatobacteraceae bacterium]|nr:polysaccharide deacetylase family protein [Ilumatobacteraceae bacterium]